MEDALSAKPFTGLGKVFAENVSIPLRGRRFSPCLTHLPAFSGRGIPGVPCIVTMHDLAFCREPSWFPRLRSAYYGHHFGRSVRRADIVMVDSDFTASEAVSMLGIDRSRIRRVYLCTDSFAADPGEFRRSWGIDGDYVLFTGTLEPRKNLSELLGAWPGIRRKHPGTVLVIAGRPGWKSRGLAARMEAGDGVVYTGSLSHGMLRSCVSGARLMVYPSLYEGFGLPPLEAASAGVPSVVTPAGALVEVYGEVATVARGFDAVSIEAAVLDALESRTDPAVLRDFASGFSVGSMAERVMDVYGEFCR